MFLIDQALSVRALQELLTSGEDVSDIGYNKNYITNSLYIIVIHLFMRTCQFFLTEFCNGLRTQNLIIWKRHPSETRKE